MSHALEFDKELFKGLKELAEAAFPKHCKSCGRTFQTAAEFVAQTVPVRAGKSGLKKSVDDDGNSIVELFRNCVCGSTLMDFFSDRRDLSDAGLARRNKFGELLDHLIEKGFDRLVARAELLKVLRGEKSDILHITSKQNP